MIFDDRSPGKRNFVSFPVTDFHVIKRQMLTWAVSYDFGGAGDIFCFLDNQGYKAGILPTFECLLAVGAVDKINASAGNAFGQLKEWAAGRREWIFGHLAYDLSAETEPIPGPPPPGPGTDLIGFPDLFFFIPEIVIELTSAGIRIGSFQDDQEAIWEAILSAPTSPNPAFPGPATALISGFIPRFSREEYLATIRELQRHILKGDCYEINFCQEFFCQPVHPDPLATWWSLSQASPNPFSAFYRLNNSYLFCASPERYLKKTGNTLFSQPIKGTLARPQEQSGSQGGAAADQAAAQELFHSAKDRSENVMIVDLVRNDLSKVCLPGSVRVKELYGIYPFPQVFQMISTITGEMIPDRDWVDAIQATFPMGSMTGAPKNRVVRLIHQYERSRRGIFSGAVGYVTPDGDFDFNVVIRSLLYNQDTHYLAYQVGSGITFYSDPLAEYEECLVKAKGIRTALGSN